MDEKSYYNGECQPLALTDKTQANYSEQINNINLNLQKKMILYINFLKNNQ